jgi:hypothetical protein
VRPSQDWPAGETLPVGVEKAQHVIEGAVFQHQHDDVIDRRELTGTHHVLHRRHFATRNLLPPCAFLQRLAAIENHWRYTQMTLNAGTTRRMTWREFH